MSAHTVRVRIAPSPTGPITLGTARTALFNWLFARKEGGTFILRIEDTDRERSKKEYESVIYEGLKWLRLTWDEGPDIEHDKSIEKGNFGPYRQSERFNVYKKYLDELMRQKKTYYCYCTKEELEAERNAFLAEGLPPRYSGHCRELKEAPPGREPQVVRLKTPRERVTFKDMVRGKVSFESDLLGDMVIAKVPFAPLYNFAVVVDDHEMRISHIIRGEDHLSNTPKQLLILQALGFKEPVYAHIPLLLDSGRGKLSKRTASFSFLEYRDKGYLPEAMLNFLALLGWHPSDNQEVFALDELIKKFDLKRVQKAGAVLNLEKLDWLNVQHMKRLRTEDIAERVKPFLKSAHIKPDESFLLKVVEAERERIKTLSEFPETARFFFKLPEYPPDLLRWQKDPKETVLRILQEVREKVLTLPSSVSRLDSTSALEALIGKEGKGTVLWPLRVALSGKSASPDPYTILEVLGKEESLRRIDHAI